MNQRILPGDPPVELTLRRSSRARRFSLRVSQLDGKVTLSMPARAREAEALAFAYGKADWVRQALLQSARPERLAPGHVMPFEGRSLTVSVAPVRSVCILGDEILVPASAADVGVRVRAYLKLAARQRLQAASEVYAGRLGRSFARLTLRDTRSRWGSCTADGCLMYSWRLIMAPQDVLNYVAAHEVAHLEEMNHSEAFWTVVGRLMPDYARHRRWLRTHGPSLHRVDFGD
ncbi:MAG: SprT family zinc-dependent metalloprotease [Albidovulum sp.]|uniref:M48 family metallopeptidase n=1 Tax=Albidovulum sp. TaxID=1872424 RepID=UPI003CA6ED32